ncbi:hypothetical protein BDV96DRAFT_674465 [Lophiotrema nucula]|uniref:Uncharacterized protein n=1 Tax=Lophiotrema nucula TaxID=690887 RepID=A0A6A5ZMY3_9PLEO|nr:hypothetical protein BDV96DRAFT_674465 [Lophiotrema nucula]
MEFNTIFLFAVITILCLVFSTFAILFGATLVNLYKRNGNLHLKLTKPVIIPAYRQEATAKYVEDLKARTGRTDTTTSTSRGGNGDGDDDHGSRTTERVEIEAIKRRIAREDKRISKLPTFEQDDCGDGTNFPEVQMADTLSTVQPYPLPPFRERPPNYMQMGLKKLDIDAWLTVDKNYRDQHGVRKKLLDRKKEEVLQVTDDGEEACIELMEEVVGFLVKKYPKYFQLVERDGRTKVLNAIMEEEFCVQRPYEMHPLEVCARLANEDFNILFKSEFSGEHVLAASATLFPAGWRLRERIGTSVSLLHNPVPQWQDIPDILSHSYFTRLSETSCMERHSFFIQINPGDRTLQDLLFIQNPQDFFPGRISALSPSHIIVRRERQSFRRLPKSNTVVFTVKTTMQRLIDVPEANRPALVSEIKAWPEDIAAYKGLAIWQRAVFGFCEGKRTVVEDQDLGSDVGTLTRIEE